MARIFGLPETHENNFHLKAVVCIFSSPTYYMSKVFNNVLNFALQKPRYFTRKAIDLKQKVDEIIM